MIKLYKNKYTVKMSNAGNRDHGQNSARPLLGTAIGIFQGENIQDCQKACTDYIDKYDLGGGNWDGGEVYFNGEYVGRISYNGRFWPKDTEYGKELK